MVVFGAILVAAAMAFIAIVIDAGLAGLRKSYDQQTNAIIELTRIIRNTSPEEKF